MKSAIGIMTLGLVLLLSVPAKAQPGYSVSMQTFYDELSPYGEWIDDPSYGYVWRPGVGGDFRPYYSNGHWVMTEYGNTWVSDYDWGWAPFHYGRWTYDDYYGWVWIPDSEWGPAWVSWRDGGGYYGWAPMGPNISVSISFGPRYYVPDNWWVFIPYNYMYRNDFYRHYRGPRYNRTIINQTTIINNSYHNRYAYGPRPSEFQGRTGQRVNVYNINNINRPQRSSVRGNTVDLYRPQVAQSGPRGGGMRPQNAVRAERPISMSPANNNPRATQQRPVPAETQVNRPSGRDMDRNEVRNNNNVPQARPERNDDRADRQRAEVQRQSQQQAIENNRQQQWERQRAAQVQQQQAQQQQAQQAQRQQQIDQQRQQQAQQAQRQQQMDQQQRQQAQQMQRQQQMQQQQAQQAQRQQQMDQQRQQQAQQQQMQRQQQMQQQQIQRQAPQRTEQRAPQQAQPQGDKGGRFR